MRMPDLGPRAGRLVLAFPLLLVSAGAGAGSAFGEETFVARLGTFVSDFDTNVRLSGPNGGDSVNLEDALGLDANQTTFNGQVVWRFAPRHRLQVGYLDFQRDAASTAQRDFTVDTDDGTYEFSAGATIETEFDWSLIPITYAYSFYKTDTLEMAGSIGVHWFDAKIGFAGSATVTPPGGVPGVVAAAATAETASGPLPVLGLEANYAVAENWRLGARAGWFGLDYDEYSGELIDLGLSAEYWFSDHFGAGLGYSYYSIEITESKDAYRIGADYTYQGVQAYITVRY